MVCVLSVAAPIILTSLLFYAYYYLGVESFFTKQIANSVSNTVKIAQHYMIEHKNNIKVEAFIVANIIERSGVKSGGILRALNEQAFERGLAEILIFNKNMLVARSTIGIPVFPNRLPDHVIQEVLQHEVALIDDTIGKKVHAVIKLHSLANIYLVISRHLDPKIVRYLEETKGSAMHYQELQHGIESTKDKLEIAFFFISLSMVFFSIVIANKIANKIVNPLEKLSNAVLGIRSDNVSFINLKAIGSKYEITILAKAFNSMLQKVKRQHSEILKIKDLADARRIFIEKILAEIKTGVIVINKKANVHLINNAALSILSLNEKDYTGVKISEIFNEIGHVITDFFNGKLIEFSKNIIIERNDSYINLFIKMVAIINKESIESIVITITDITELVAAQKSAAWGEIAKRIAHEIRNPLTPILLASEILKKNIFQHKYDEKLFARYIDSIMQNVENINHMVTDFIDFAKLQSPIFTDCDIRNIIKDTVLIHRIANPNISYNFIDLVEVDCIISCDRTHISRAITNLLKNSAEAIYLRKIKGVISIILSHKTCNYISIKIEDNGGGIKKEILPTIKEPYVTTKEEGVGIGLSIVQKIMDDHMGIFDLKNIEDGVCTELYIPKNFTQR